MHFDLSQDVAVLRNEVRNLLGVNPVPIWMVTEGAARVFGSVVRVIAGQ